jgi:hypothetical protein
MENEQEQNITSLNASRGLYCELYKGCCIALPSRPGFVSTPHHTLLRGMTFPFNLRTLEVQSYGRTTVQMSIKMFTCVCFHAVAKNL